MTEETIQKIGKLFSACDVDGSGFIDEAELSRMCPDLSEDDVKAVFKALDKNGDGQISKSEFSDGFQGLGALAGRKKSTVRQQNRDEDGEPDPGIFLQNLDEGFTALSCQEQVCDLYQKLHGHELNEVLGEFEQVIVCILKDIRQQQFEKERLESSYRREKEQHANHLQQLEEEMEAQMARVEARVRHEEQERFEAERKELQARFEVEVIELQSNLKRLQKIEKDVKRDHQKDDTKTRLSEIMTENRQLKSSLTETQTNMAIIRSELATLQQEYRDRLDELESEREAMVDYMKEQENLTRQLHLLHDANRKLHDANDDLRSALENNRAHKRMHNGSTAPRIVPMRHHPSIDNLAMVVEAPAALTAGYARHGSTDSYHGIPTLADELENSDTVLQVCDPAHQRSQRSISRSMSTATDNCDVESLPEDIDSGHFTLRDGRDVDSDHADPNSFDEDLQQTAPRKRNRRFHGMPHNGHSSEVSESQDEMETELELGHSPEEGDEIDEQSLERPCSVCSQTSSHSRASSRASSSRRRGTVIRRQPPLAAPPKKITGDPERMYKVVLAGDAAVGKSSFIMRLCKGKFVTNLSSTLGVDFQTKVLEVDGRVVALQLWDTAGQERFRSIAKSYFRRADGVLLLYDCSWENSFLSIREWVNAIEESATKKIPIMLCGNKSDLREAAKMENRKVVPYEDGKRLAREFEALFVETSAKEGSNVLESVTELARLLRANEDLEVQSVGMQLQDMKTARNTTSCCK